jgi:cysteine-S-conjugate beta-lyase
MLFCHPHNPLGRVFRERELLTLAELADRHDLVVVSDEVHADLTYPEHRHLPFAPFSPERTVTLNAPSKAFNVAGLRTAVCVAPAPLLARLAALPPTRWSAFSTLGVRAALAAWSDEGAAWLDACLVHLAAMRDRVASRLPPVIDCCPPEASYLAWLDCRSLGLDDPAAFFLERARVRLSAGTDFGVTGTGHVRLNFATSAEILDEILDRIASALA